MRVTILATLVFVGLAHTVHGQSAERIRISINAGGQVTPRTLNQSFTVPINVEPASLTTAIDLKAAPAFDIGGSYRFLDRIAAGVEVSSISNTVGGTLDAKIPHPFFFNQLRPISGSLSGLTHKEIGVHIYAMYFIPIGRKVDLGVFAGPSHFSVNQDFVTDVDYTATYPYDTATFTGAPTTRVSTSAIGYNWGADVSYHLTRLFAVGGLVRFTGASTTISVGSGNDVDAKIGGLQTGGGIRISF